MHQYQHEQQNPSDHFFCVPYPIATTSSIPITSSSILTLILVWLPTTTSCVLIPTKEKTNVASSGMLVRVYFPSMSVMVPDVVPFTTTVTPGSGCPLLSVTFPDTVRCCCCSSAVSSTGSLLA